MRKPRLAQSFSMSIELFSRLVCVGIKVIDDTDEVIADRLKGVCKRDIFALVCRQNGLLVRAVLIVHGADGEGLGAVKRGEHVAVLRAGHVNLIDVLAFHNGIDADGAGDQRGEEILMIFSFHV